MDFNLGVTKIVAVILPLIFIFSCGRESGPHEDFVAQVNDQYLLNEQLQYGVPAGLDENVAFTLKKNIISKWVEDELLYQSALAEGLTLNEKERYLVGNYSKSLLIQHYLDQKLDKSYHVPQKEIDEYYRDHLAEFKRSRDEVHIYHLFVEHRDQAIFREIAQARDLLSIIEKYYFNEKSTYESPNGDLGYVPVSSLPDNFNRAIRRMKTGAISSPVQTDKGYHFMQLIDRQDKGSQIDLDLVRHKIMLRLKKEKRDTEFLRLKTELKKQAQIQTYISKIKQ